MMLSVKMKFMGKVLLANGVHLFVLYPLFYACFAIPSSIMEYATSASATMIATTRLIELVLMFCFAIAITRERALMTCLALAFIASHLFYTEGYLFTGQLGYIASACILLIIQYETRYHGFSLAVGEKVIFLAEPPTKASDKEVVFVEGRIIEHIENEGYIVRSEDKTNDYVGRLGRDILPLSGVTE